MMNMEPYQLTLLIAFVFGIIEVLTLTFIFLSFALSFIAIAIFQYMTGEFSINREMGIFTTFSIFFTIFFRGLFRGKKDQKEMKIDDDVNLY